MGINGNYALLKIYKNLPLRFRVNFTSNFIYMKIKLIGNGHYEVIHKNKVIGRFDKYDLDTLNNAQVGATLNFAD